MLLALLGLSCVAASPPSASAEFGIEPGSFKVRMLDAEGNQEGGAGSHPDRLQIDFGLSLEGSETTARDLVFELPPGFGGDPSAVPHCPRGLFEKDEECPAESQVGLLRFALSEGPELELPIFQLEPVEGEVIAFGSKPNVDLTLTMELRPDDFGITLRAADLAPAPITEGHAELWGIPAHHQQGTEIAARPFLTAPTRCGPLPFTFRTRSWQESAPWLSAATDVETPLSGCESLAFRPRLGLQLDNPIVDAPTGVRMEMTTPDEEEGSPRADAQIKDVTIDFPPGVAISPGGAQGLTACTDAQLGVGSSDAALCPASSQVGTAEFDTPALPGSLSGAVYLGEERPGERFRLFVVATAAGTVVKFVGAMSVDPHTGRLSARLEDLPQVSIRRLSMSLSGGSRSMLATPLGCGAGEATGSFVPYGGGPAVLSTATVAVAGRGPGWPCPGPGPFAPRLLASGSNPRAGQLSVFATTLLRGEGEQLPRRFSIVLPAGLSAALGKVQVCPDSLAAAVACPPGSRIGGLTAKVGSGPSPVALPGDVHLTGPYRGAPFGLLMQMPAAVGPFDFGTLAFRARIEVNSRNGRVTVSSDPLPDVIEGMPVRFQALELSMDRPGFIRNPTACRPARVEATIEAQSGTVAAAASSIALRGCGRLGFHPRFRVVIASPGGAAPSMQVSARPRPGDTSLRSMTISLPRQLRFDISRLAEICSRYDALAGACPAGSRVGTAKALSGLLSKPLRGAIHLVQPAGEGQPDFWFSLGAMGVRLQLQARASVVEGRLVTKLQGLPDMPLSALTMRFGGRQRDVLSLDGGPCSRGQPRQFESVVRASGQDGSRRRVRLPIDVKAPCR